MINEEALKSTLIYLVEAAKRSIENEAALLLEVRVLRDTVKDLDPTFMDNFEHRKIEVISEVAEHAYNTGQTFEKLLKLLKQGSIC